MCATNFGFLAPSLRGISSSATHASTPSGSLADISGTCV